MRTFSTFRVVTGAFVVALLIAAAALTVSGQAQPGAGDRGNRRMQVFELLDQWPFNNPSSVNFLYANGDGSVGVFENPTARVVKYDREGHLMYAWGSLGDNPGAFLNMHGAAVDPDGDLYLAEVGNARFQTFRPRAGARSDRLVGKPPVAS